jgi:hypothetical protein
VQAHAVVVAAAAIVHVLLRSSGIDPRVLVFTQRAVLEQYRSGHWATRDVMNHCFVVDAGTAAVVVGRRAGDVGVKLTAGPFRGRYGWVSEDDVQ